MRTTFLIVSFLLAALVVFASGHARGTDTVIRSESEAEAPVPAALSEAKLLFVGDMFFDRYIRKTIREKGGDHVFSCMKELFDAHDMVIGNLEGPITDEDSISEGSEIGSPENYRFTFPSSTARLLAEHGVHAVSLGNNHINNQGRAGLASTQRFLAGSGVGYFGGMKGDEPVLEAEINGVPIAFIGYNEFLGEGAATTSLLVAAERAQGRLPIVFAHWGDEYSTATARLKPIAEEFASSGAALIVGAHPHIVLSDEVIASSTPVFYSLGNFIFDQYWSADVRRGIALSVVFDQNGARDIVRYDTELSRNGKTCLSSVRPD